MDEQFRNEMMDQAIEVLRKCAREDQSFCPVVSAKDGDTVCVLGAPWKNDKEKYLMLRQVGKFLGEKGIYQCMVVTDSYLRMEQDPEKLKYIQENWATEQPSLYPEAFQRHALVMVGIDFKDMKNESFCITEYKKVNKDVSIVNTQKGQDPQMIGGVKDTLLEGFMVGLCKGVPPTRGTVSKIARDYPGIMSYISFRNKHTGG